MHPIRIGLALMLAIWLVGLVNSCNFMGSMGYSGPKRYKTELLANFAKVQKEIEKNGIVSEPALKKVKDILVNWEEEMGKQGSYMRAQKIIESCEAAKANPDDAYRNYQNALADIYRLQEILKTEVVD